MNVPSPPVLRPEDFPEVDPNLLAAITRALRQQSDALASTPACVLRDGVRMASSDTGTAYLHVKHEGTPQHAWLTRITPSDGSEISTPFSQTWVRASSGFRFLFAGLTPETVFSCSVVYL